MRCPDCNKFVGLETQVETQDEPEVDTDGEVSGSVRVYRTCAECSQELKESVFDISHNLLESVDNGMMDKKLAAKIRKWIESDDRDESFSVEFDDPTETESGGGRYKKNMIGYELAYQIKNKKGEVVFEGSISDEAQASSFEELV